MEDLFYPSATEWMWNYCISLGKFTDSDGNNYDLGMYKTPYGTFSNATVYGNNPGDYISGEIHPKLIFDNEISREVLKRTKEQNII
jgi:hypothetical protein